MNKSTIYKPKQKHTASLSGFTRLLNSYECPRNQCFMQFDWSNLKKVKQGTRLKDEYQQKLTKGKQERKVVSEETFRNELIEKGLKINKAYESIHHFATHIDDLQWILQKASYLIQQYHHETIAFQKGSHQHQINNLLQEINNLNARFNRQEFSSLDTLNPTSLTQIFNPEKAPTVEHSGSVIKRALSESMKIEKMSFPEEPKVEDEINCQFSKILIGNDQQQQLPKKLKVATSKGDQSCQTEQDLNQKHMMRLSQQNWELHEDLKKMRNDIKQQESMIEKVHILERTLKRMRGSLVLLKKNNPYLKQDTLNDLEDIIYSVALQPTYPTDQDKENHNQFNEDQAELFPQSCLTRKHQYSSLPQKSDQHLLLCLFAQASTIEQLLQN